MSERRNLAENELGKLQLYQQLMSYQLSWCLTYAVLFVTIELGVLFLAIQLKEVGSIANLVMIGIAGFAIGLIFLWFYYISAREMDRWKECDHGPPVYKRQRRRPVPRSATRDQGSARRCPRHERSRCTGLPADVT